MPLCRDPLISSLRAQGFNALRVPRKDYVPGVLLFQPRRSGLEVFGPAQSAFADLQPWQISEGSNARTFTTLSTGRYRLSAALKLASQWLGLPEGALAAAFGGSSRVSFHFSSMRLLSCDLGTIASALAAHAPAPALLALPESRLFIVHEVLQARVISWLNETEAEGRIGVETEIAVAAKENGFEIDTTNASQGMLMFSSTEYHSIGFKAYEIELSDGNYCLKRSMEGTAFSHMSDVDSSYVPALFDDTLF